MKQIEKKKKLLYNHSKPLFITDLNLASMSEQLAAGMPTAGGLIPESSDFLLV